MLDEIPCRRIVLVFGNRKKVLETGLAGEKPIYRIEGWGWLDECRLENHEEAWEDFWKRKKENENDLRN